MTTTNNFFDNVINLTSDDVLFLDTNFLVALIFDTEPYHEVVKHFFVHTINSDCMLFTSATVVKELQFTIAKILYATDMVNEGKYTKNQAKGNWGNLPKTSDKDLVKHYNELARKKIETALKLIEFSNTNFDTTSLALHFSTQYNLHSGDAFIVSSTYLLQAKLITLDKDFNSVDQIEVIFAHNGNPKIFNPSMYNGIENHDVILKHLENIFALK